jgi:phytoene synthase
VRPAFDALIDIDDALRDVVASSTQAALGAIRLAWWRDALKRLDQAPPPPEPRLQAAAAELLPRGVSGAMLAALEDGNAALLDETIDWTRVGDGGAALFAIGGRLLGDDDPGLGEAGRFYALGQAARLGCLGAPAEIPSLRGHRFARRLRPLTALSRLAVRDLRRRHDVEPEATPGRAAALIIHRLNGAIA